MSDPSGKRQSDYPALPKPAFVEPGQFWRRRYAAGRALCVVRVEDRAGPSGSLEQWAVFRKNQEELSDSMLKSFDWEYLGRRSP